MGKRGGINASKKKKPRTKSPNQLTIHIKITAGECGYTEQEGTNLVTRESLSES